MEQVLQNFITSLRASGIRISISESLDASRTVSFLGYGDRQLFKDALSTVLAKSLPEKKLFDDCFEQFFSYELFSEAETSSSPESAGDSDQQDSNLTQMLLNTDLAGLTMAVAEAAERIEVQNISFFTQKGLYAYRLMKELGMKELNEDISRLDGERGEAPRQKAEKLKTARSFLIENVRDFIERQYSLFSGAQTAELLERYLRTMRLSNIEQRDFERMQLIIKKIIKRLNDLHSRKKKRAKRGHLDFKKSLRENLSCEGLLFNLRWKYKKESRPNIIAICDVSRSVEAFSRFMLLFLYGLNEAVARIRSFVFCSNLVEVSRIFEEHSVEEALVRIKKGVGIDLQMGPTDYGQAFIDFKENWLDSVNQKTTVIILGDARNNLGDPKIDILRLIHERSKLLIWLNPESPPFWGIGDSEMKRYQPYCSLARECSTVNHLERVVDYLLRVND
jgi:uncharacterized protein with von Willebrand factor type A (vWA) domain